MLTITRNSLNSKGTYPNRCLVYLDLPDGRRITITVYDVKSNWVRLGIDAPRDVAIERADLHFRKAGGQ